ncbi:MAG: alpha 2-mannosidase [Sphingobacteriales bacterium]|nr:alpha 2-mannosidase [Sphingobacteriales bacterium]
MSLFFEDQAVAQGIDYTKYVNTFIGSGATGHTFPGAVVPYGLVQLSPETGNFDWSYCSGYRNTDSVIHGFAHTHLNGTGMPDLGDVLFFPFSGSRNRKEFKSRFSKSSERASPGYYTVILTDGNIKTELTATQRVGVHRYTFAQGGQSHLLIDFQSGLVSNKDALADRVLASEITVVNKTTISGFIRTKNWVDKKTYFYIRFDKPFIGSSFIDPQKRRLIVDFTMKAGEQVGAKVAISTVSVAGAEKNLAEVGIKGFDAVKLTAKNNWNQYLSKVAIEGTQEQKENFYTCMYHLFSQPANIADVDGQYRGVDDRVKTSANKAYYSTLSLWDTYRASHPLYTILDPAKDADIVASMVQHFDAVGTLPVWTLWGKENFCMIGNHSVPVIVDAYLKGLKGFDAEKAYAAVKTTLTHNGNPKYDWTIYDKYGYLPADLVKVESVSRTLEGAYDDWCAAQMAKALGKTADYDFFMKRSNYYVNVFDPSTGLMRGRKADGSWVSPFDKLKISHADSKGGDYTEGNAWQYVWQVQHDIPGLIKLMGGKEKFAAKLDSLFSMDSKVYGDGLTLDVTGLIGQYAHGNEVSHHVAYLYNYVDQPWKTQKLIPRILRDQYQNNPEGLSGNDDCGQMSAWYILSALGFYPVNPVGGEYVLNVPFYEKAVINLADGKRFVVEAKNRSERNSYVQKIELNGVVHSSGFLSHRDIMNGGSLVFSMGPEPKNNK